MALDEDVWWRIADDSVSPEDFVIPEEWVYLLAFEQDSPAGMFVLHETDEGLMCHIVVMPNFRHLKYEIGAAVLSASKEFADRLIATIPKEHPNVHGYALQNGFIVINEDDSNWYYERYL